MSYKVTMVISNLDFEPTDNDLYEIQYRAADWLCINPERVEIRLDELKPCEEKKEEE